MGRVGMGVEGNKRCRSGEVELWRGMAGKGRSPKERAQCLHTDYSVGDRRGHALIARRGKWSPRGGRDGRVQTTPPLPPASTTSRGSH